MYYKDGNRLIIRKPRSTDVNEFCDGGKIDECPVCLDNLDCYDGVQKGKCVVTPCGHPFHKECLLFWLDGGKKACPICRYEIIKEVSTY